MMIRKYRKPSWAFLMVLYLLCLSGTPTLAGMIGSVTSRPSMDQETRQQELSVIQLALENELIKAKLEAYGLTPDEIQAKLQGLSDERIHLLAQASDNVLAGGDGLGVVIGILVIILLIILILHLTGHSVLIK
jgi:hypothetical protein